MAQRRDNLNYSPFKIVTDTKKSDPDPYFQPLDHEIEGVVDDEHIEDNNAEYHKSKYMTSPAPQIHQPPELSVQSPLDQLVIYKGDTNS